MIGDESLVYFREGGFLRGIISIHVDDFQGAGDSHFRMNVMNKLEETFKISKRETGKFKYTGVDVEKCKDGSILLDQEVYTESLDKIEVDVKDDPLRSLSRK